MKRRYRYIDIAKGVSILAVLFYHGGGIPIFLPLLTGFFLPVFFITRGFITDQKRVVNKGRCIKGALNEIKIYFLSSIVLSVLYIMWQLYVGNKVNYWKIVLGIIYGRYSVINPQNAATDNIILMNNLTHPLWFLPAFAISSLIFYMIIDKCLVAIKAFYCCILCIILSMLLSKIDILLPWSLDTVPVFIAFMIFGYYLRENIFKAPFSKKLSFKGIIIFVLLFILYTCLRVINGSINIAVRIYGSQGIISVFLYVAIGCLGTILVYIASNYIANTLIGKVLEYIGKRTLFIYISHMAVFTFLEPLIQKTSSIWLNFVQWVLIVIIAVIVGLLINCILNVKAHKKEV